VTEIRAPRAQTLTDPYGHCDQQTLDEAIALDRLPGDKSFLRDHLRSYGCQLIFPREGLQPFPPERRDGERPRER
jgi:hypothetical protein